MLLPIHKDTRCRNIRAHLGEHMSFPRVFQLRPGACTSCQDLATVPTPTARASVHSAEGAARAQKPFLLDHPVPLPITSTVLEGDPQTQNSLHQLS